MKTVGDIIKEARVKNKLSIEYIASRTKIRVEYLEAIEANAFEKLPSAIHAKGFITNYAKYIGLNTANVLAVFRRDFVSDKVGRVVPRGFTDPIAIKTRVFNPTTTAIFFFCCY